MDLLAIFNTAMADQEAGRLEEAERGYRAVLAQVFHMPSQLNLAVLLEQSGRAAAARAAYERAAAESPADARGHAALGNHLRGARALVESEAAYRRALALDPANAVVAFDLGSVLLAQERFEEGWALYEQRSARAYVLRQNLATPEWRGEPLAGKRLLVWREQGYGDQIMMARFLKRLEGAQVTYLGLPALERLFAPLPLRYQVAGGGEVDMSAFDYWVLPLSLPDRLGMSAATAWDGPYLAGQARPQAQRAGHVGLVWRGEPSNRNDRFRALPAEQAQRLLSRPGVISLEPADTGARDFQDTADIIASLDLVISADTGVAHLAGAMGAPLWVLLAQHALDWHWPRAGASPWYPAARLMAQPAAGDWAGLVDRVIADLDATAL